MFDGVSEQLHQFIASSRTTQLALPSLSFSSLHHPNNTIFPTFDPFTSTNSPPPQVLPLQVQPSFLHPFNQQSQAQKSSDEEKQEESDSLVGTMSNNLEIGIERRTESSVSAWSNDEVLALLRIRSSLDNWSPESTWAHVSRKLEELGYKRSAEKCKEKFEEEESRYMSNINYNKISHRFYNEFEDIYSNIHGQSPHDDDDDDGDDGDDDKNSKSKLEKPRVEEQVQAKNYFLDGLKDSNKKDQNLVSQSEDAFSERLSVEIKEKPSKGEKKRKRVLQQQKKKKEKDDQFEMLKGFCENIVKKMMDQQEEMHLKLLEDMVKRDEEKVAREEAWRKQEMDRINKELKIRAHEQAIAGDRQATLIKFLKRFTSSSASGSSSSEQNQCFQDQISSEENPAKVLLNNSSTPSSSLILPQNPNDLITCKAQAPNHQVQYPSSNLDDQPKPPTSQNPNSDPNITQKNPLSPTSVSTQTAHQNPSSIILSNDRDDDIGKRWPRDEVFALINLRCSLQNNGDHHHRQDKEGQAKIPLWERISQGMSELGYKRSAKRCKEKWENINKYFRKTKDVNKKRSLDSRTCPYFHQLSTLYSQGTLVAPSEEGAAGKLPSLPENHSTPSENHPASSQAGSSCTDSTMHVGDEKILVQVPTFDFEF